MVFFLVLLSCFFFNWLIVTDSNALHYGNNAFCHEFYLCIYFVGKGFQKSGVVSLFYQRK